jgi:hypothetical protein
MQSPATRFCAISRSMHRVILYPSVRAHALSLRHQASITRTGCMNPSSIFYSKSRNLNNSFHSDEAMAENLSILPHELGGSRRIYELGESIHSWFNLKLPGTTGKHESSRKQRFPGSPRNVVIVQVTADLTRLTHSRGYQWTTLGRARFDCQARCRHTKYSP